MWTFFLNVTSDYVQKQSSDRQANEERTDFVHSIQFLWLPTPKVLELLGRDSLSAVNLSCSSWGHTAMPDEGIMGNMTATEWRKL